MSCHLALFDSNSLMRPMRPTLPQQDEEKTIIYVLSKKPEDQAEINVQAAAPTTPTKPEVYFIKYNTKKEQSGGLSLSAANGPSSSYGVPASISANVAAPSNSYIPAPIPQAAAPSSSYGVPSANGGPY
ncbi:Cuticle Protein Tweedle 10 [Frankliniella occidentalis]|nr:Cuticle Protein Tweedle 10 [Frankliniella occidentalis]